MVKNPPSNAGDTGLSPGPGTKILHAAGQLSPHATTPELMHLSETACMPQTTKPTRSGTHAPQGERENPRATTREKPARCNEEILRASTKTPCATTKTRRSQKIYIRKINKY